MTEWLEYPKEKPKHDQLCYVYDADWNLDCFFAIYHQKYDTFCLYDPNSCHPPSLKVSHWIPLPPPFLRR